MVEMMSLRMSFLLRLDLGGISRLRLCLPRKDTKIPEMICLSLEKRMAARASRFHSGRTARSHCGVALRSSPGMAMAE